MRIYIETLGCKVNQFESQAMAALLEEKGHSITQNAEDCDAFIVNTCAVTAESGRKSRQAVRRLRAANPGAIGVVCGCYAQIEPREASQLGVELVCGSANRREVTELIDTLLPGCEPAIKVDKALARRKIEQLPSGRLPGRTRALMRIQDGCVNFCTYCIIPYSRGPIRSMPMEECAQEACRLNGEGFKEIIITGIEIAGYGRDLPGKPTLIDALETICAAAPDARIRLGSLEPRVITEEFCKRAAVLNNLCPHFHLSLQSGCDKTLAAMHRKYTTADFYAVTERLRQYFPNCALTTDVITGFPGETEEDFAETMAFLEKCAFAAMHVFPYSQRPGTPAASMPEQTEKAVKAERAARASKLGEKMKESYLESCIGSIQYVVFETEDGTRSYGHSANYCEVAVDSTGIHGEMLKTEIYGRDRNMLLGKLTL